MIESISMPDEEYFKAKGISKSLLSRMDCPDKAGIYKESTPAMMLGTISHCAILEPDEFYKRYVVDPKMSKRSNADKEAWKKWQEDNEGRTVITAEQFEKAMGMAESVRNHPKAISLLTGGKAEQAFFWTDEKTGELCKCKADYVVGNTISDLKTCADASPDGFGRAVANFGYNMQDAWYTRGTEAERFVFIAVETTAPYIVEVYELNQEAKDHGLDKCDAAVQKLLFHKNFEPFKGYTGYQEVTELVLPPWALK